MFKFFFISAFIQNFVGLIDFVLIQKRRLEQNSFAVKYIMVTKLNIEMVLFGDSGNLW
jgi:hypothetical protein